MKIVKFVEKYSVQIIIVTVPLFIIFWLNI